jgi:hypothetical protein
MNDSITVWPQCGVLDPLNMTPRTLHLWRFAGTSCSSARRRWHVLILGTVWHTEGQQTSSATGVAATALDTRE